MKKIFLLFSIILFTSCGSDDESLIPDPTPTPNPTPTPTEWKGDWNDSGNPNYVEEGYNPIIGDWIVEKRDGKNVSDFTVYSFGDVRASAYVMKSTIRPKEGEAPVYDKKKLYDINDKAYRLRDEKDKIYYYTLIKFQSLTIFDGSITLYLTPYDNNGVWKWKGNWNASYFPQYDLYKGKYNPLKGIWKLLYYNGAKIKSDQYLKFDERNLAMEAFDSKLEFKWTRGCWFNDTGVREGGYRIGPTTYMPDATYKYEITGDTLYYDRTEYQYNYIYVKFKEK